MMSILCETLAACGSIADTSVTARSVASNDRRASKFHDRGATAIRATIETDRHLPRIGSPRLRAMVKMNRPEHRLLYGRGSVILSEHEVFFPNRKRYRPVLSNFVARRAKLSNLSSDA